MANNYSQKCPTTKHTLFYLKYVVAREIEGMLYSVMKFWLEKLIFGFSAKKIVKKTATYYLSLKNVNDFAHFFLPFLERMRFLSNAYSF